MRTSRAALWATEFGTEPVPGVRRSCLCCLRRSGPCPPRRPYPLSHWRQSPPLREPGWRCRTTRRRRLGQTTSWHDLRTCASSRSEPTTTGAGAGAPRRSDGSPSIGSGSALNGCQEARGNRQVPRPRGLEAKGGDLAVDANVRNGPARRTSWVASSNVVGMPAASMVTSAPTPSARPRTIAKGLHDHSPRSRFPWQTRVMSGWQLAQVNIGRLREPLDHPQLAAFVEALD
jgi:hypothetical protein